jgi:hypothetical protein
MTDERITLTGGPEKTVTWIWLERGQLKVELYDFSKVAQNMFGNDIAYTITLRDMNKFYSITKQNEASILPWIDGNFQSYFDIRSWLEQNAIEFSVERESWA